MANTRVVVSLNGTNINERRFVAELVQYLYARNIEVVADDLSLPENRVIHELLNNQWLILILTPETARIGRIQAVVNAGLEYVEQGHLQGVLALTYGNAPIEAEEMPYPWWSTIRAYHAGESDEDHRRAFEKAQRTVSYVRVPVLARASSTANSRNPQDALYDTRTSRPLLVQPPPAPKRRVPLRVLALSMVVLLSVFSGMLIDSYFFHRSSAKSALVIPTTKPTLTANAKQASSTATAQATLTAIANATAVAAANELYRQATGTNTTLNDPMNEQDTNYPWDSQAPCMFQGGQYHISPSPGKEVTCMATNTSFTNFAYQVQMTMISENGDGGLIFRSDNAVSTFYSFSLNSSGQYTLLVCQQCTGIVNGEKGSRMLKQGQMTGFSINTRQSISLAVIGINQTFYIYINGMNVTQVSDSTITGPGEIGLYAASVKGITQSTDVAFSNVKVWEINNSNGSHGRLS